MHTDQLQQQNQQQQQQQQHSEAYGHETHATLRKCLEI